MEAPLKLCSARCAQPDHHPRFSSHRGQGRGEIWGIFSSALVKLTLQVRAWGWEEINQGNVGQPQWALDVPGGGEVNSMLVATGGTAGRLVLGTGDNNVYVFDLETRKLSSTYTGHTDRTYTGHTHGRDSMCTCLLAGPNCPFTHAKHMQNTCKPHVNHM